MQQFTFASFRFPKPLWAMPCDSLRKRLADSRKPKFTGGYYSAPTPITGGPHQGQGFYLDDAGQPFTRWQWCDTVDGSHIEHTGWFCDEFQNQTIRGLIALLPHGRYLAGWSMGEGMASDVEGEPFTDRIEAARRADRMAEIAAEHEREYQAQEDDETLVDITKAELFNHGADCA